MQQQNYCQLLLPKPWILMISPSAVNLVPRSHSVLQSQREVWFCCSPLRYSLIFDLNALQYGNECFNENEACCHSCYIKSPTLSWIMRSCKELSHITECWKSAELLVRISAWKRPSHQHSFLKEKNNIRITTEQPVHNQKLLHTKLSYELGII